MSEPIPDVEPCRITAGAFCLVHWSRADARATTCDHAKALAEVERLRGTLTKWRDEYANDTYDVLSDWLVRDLDDLLNPTEGETLDRAAEVLWASINDKGIRGRLYREDCDYLARALDAAGRLASTEHDRAVAAQAMREAADWLEAHPDGIDCESSAAVLAADKLRALAQQGNEQEGQR